MKNVYIIRSNDVNPDPRVEKIASFLMLDYNVTVLAWDRSGVNKNLHNILNKIPVIKFGPKSSFGSGFNGIFALVLWQIQLFSKLIKHRNSYNIIHACDFDTIIPSFVIKIIYKKKLVYDMFDHYGYSRAFPKFIFKFVCKLEDYFAVKSDLLILVDEVRKKQLKKINKNTIVIYNSPYYIELPKDLEYTSNTISYVGVLQPNRFILEMIDVVSKKHNWSLKIAGFGSLENHIITKLENENIKNVKYLGKVDYEKGLLQSLASEVMVAIYDPSIPNHKFASPNKYFEALMLGKIVIVANDSNIDIETNFENVGFSFNYNDINDFQRVLLQIESLSIEEKSQMSLKSKNLFNRKYSHVKLQNLLIEAYSQLNHE